MAGVSEVNKKVLDRLMATYNDSHDHSGVSGERLAARLAQLAAIGLTEEGGSQRIGFSPEERAAKELVKQWMNEAGLEVREDGAGNVIGRFTAQQDHLPVVMSGSHVDSVPNGGHFDGTLGVLAALEVAQAWKETGYRPDAPYEVVIFSDEEGARFNGGLTGSRAMMGEVNLEKQQQLKDINGDSFQSVIERDGLTVEQFMAAKRDPAEIAAFVEVHIEQGKTLEDAGIPVGIVNGIAGPCWLEVTFRGQAGHAGNTPMNQRFDALAAASQFILQVESLPKRISSTAVGTVGKIQVHPGGINVIPGEVKVYVDLRDIKRETRDQLIDAVQKEAHHIAQQRRLQVELSETLRVEPVPIYENMQQTVRTAVEALGIPPLFLPSGAGHDAMVLGRHVPVAMLFVQSKEGISHNPNEWSELNDCVQAVHVLKHLLEQLVTEEHC
ncbi:allantoate deiminase [Caldalkalibacillus uzonensis]|uniref:Allantoate deiminase n=1 Tax=Caldalkalibacillus uzonensis TaxID=353224 RepID=A0ABU0CXP1_9BACI|nr:Zn-dependent hydrolase [Caldalkalibacillus uzonensis]MDQ0340532.1 allantoate deiminase [Caldalkalibacillus uzonensis]